MALVDSDGRLFGRLNLFDAVAGVVVLIMLALGAVGYRLLRVPALPTITTLTPSTLVSGPDLRIAVQGDNFLPYQRAYLQRTKRPNAVMHDLNPMTSFDNYALVNYSAVRFLVESPQQAEIRLPDDLKPGTYDLVFQNEANVVGVREAAITITPAPPAKPTRAPGPEAVVRVKGAFRDLTKEMAGQLTAGLKLPHGASEPWGEILSVKPAVPDEARLEFGDRSVIATMATRWQVPAELRVQCTVSGAQCYLPDTVLVEPGHNTSIDALGRPLPFSVTDLLPVVQERRTLANATIRLLGRADVVDMVHEHDADLSPGGDRDDPAKITAVLKRGEISSDLVPNPPEGIIRSVDTIAFLDCAAVFPVSRAPTGWWYRGQPIKAGASITFQTDTYIVRGVITSATFSTR
ncbi:MAG: DUF4330 domain-containing protein [Acidobacteriia bacterium]|nr:DUF4330 domain-containing protein [Terriglobia bacterium]